MATEEIEISELEFTKELASDNLIPVESTTDTKATSLQVLKNWLSSFFVGKTGNETIGGNKTFTNDLYRDGAFSGNAINAIVTKDTNNKGSTRISSYYNISGVYNRMQTNNSTSGKQAYFDIICRDDGSAVWQVGGSTATRLFDLRGATEVVLPAVASNDESTKGATTKFVRDWLFSGNTSGADRYLKCPIKGQSAGTEFKIQWGHIEKGVTTITFPTPFSSATNIMVCPVAYYNSSSQVAFYDITTTGCKVYPNRSDYAIKWLAIGY